MSVVPPPMSMIMLPAASVTGSPEPIAAAIGSSTRCTSLALTRYPLSFTARRSTWVISGGTPMTSRGRRSGLLPCTFRTKCISIFSAASKSAMTPSFIGRTGLMFAGRAPEHLVRLGPDRFDRPLGGVERDDGRFVEDDAAAAREDAGVGRAEIDRDIGREGRKQAHVRRLRVERDGRAVLSQPPCPRLEERCRCCLCPNAYLVPHTCADGSAHLQEDMCVPG